MTKTTFGAVALAVVAIFSLSACGSDDNSSSHAANVSADTKSPQCSELWVEGETLPADYDGCFADNGDIVPTMEYDCANGDKWTIGPDGTALHAIVGSTVNHTNGADVSMSDAPCRMA